MKFPKKTLQQLTHQRLWYPLIFALFPLLSFYANNITLLNPGNLDLLVFLVFNLLVAVAAYGLSYLLLRNWQRAAIWASVLVGLFFGFGHLQAGLENRTIKFGPLGMSIQITGPFKIALIMSLVIMGLSWWWVRRIGSAKLPKLNKNLFFIALIFVALPLVNIIPKELAKDSVKQQAVESGQGNDYKLNLERAPKDAAKLPDIYYILLDGYARSDYLNTKYGGYNNSGFDNFLTSKGFYIAKKSHSNYAQTFISVPSTFNMEYVGGYLKERYGEKPTNELGGIQLFNDNKVVPLFKNLGYKYVQIGSTFDHTTKSKYSDLEVSGGAKTKVLGINFDFNEFAKVYLQTTALRPAIVKSIKGDNVSKILGAFNRTAQVPGFREPTLSFSHILVPHPPYIFDEHGVRPGLTEQALEGASYGDRPSFAKQTAYTNKLTQDLVQKILDKSATKPIIIVASDHGASQGLGHPHNWVAPSAKNLAGVKERMANFEAFYFPDGDYKRLYPSITPVNIFRVILNQFYGQNFVLLPDKVFFSVTGNERLYEFFDITKQVD